MDSESKTDSTIKKPTASTEQNKLTLSYCLPRDEIQSIKILGGIDGMDIHKRLQSIISEPIEKLNLTNILDFFTFFILREQYFTTFSETEQKEIKEKITKIMKGKYIKESLESCLSDNTPYFFDYPKLQTLFKSKLKEIDSNHPCINITHPLHKKEEKSEPTPTDDDSIKLFQPEPEEKSDNESLSTNSAATKK